MNKPFEDRIVPAEFHDQRIDVVLAGLLPEFSRSQLKAWLLDEKILINSKTLKPKTKVCAGDKIQFLIDETSFDNKLPHCEAKNIPLNIVFEDAQLIVLNKQAGLTVHPGAGNAQNTLVNALLYHDESLQQLPRAGIVHRLDKDTTGLMVIAKTLESQTSLSRQIQERSMQRHYMALVQGHLISGGEINTYYGRHPRNRLKMAVTAQGREAITRYSLRKQYQDFTLVDLKLYTGRTHQIRVHMAHIQHPVFGDPLYGGRMRYPKEASQELLALLQQFRRQALHAVSLAFVHPKSQEPLEFTAPLPKDFQEILDALDAHYKNTLFENKKN